MLADARELLGDLIVTSVEAKYDERWLGLAIATAAAMRTQPVPAELMTALLDAIDATRLRGVAVAILLRCMQRAPWAELCLLRSGFEAVRELVESKYFADLDPSEIEREMFNLGRELYRAREVPDDIPPWHWWWRGPVPPNEPTLQANERMRALLPEWSPGTSPPATDVVAPKFRELVARGFAEVDGALLFRDVLGYKRVRDFSDEADANRLQLADVLVRDPSQRPVDLAAAALACARHLAYELQRRQLRPSRIVITVQPGLNTLTFHRQKPVNLDGWPGARLVLDS